ncbi:flocculation protein FLO11-like [Quillaja saponaria]|uniref:Flocculation protein FLO11-like n=2 Tax=Quillaja saponaria TaxID=32244 RepID=A0AAD7LD65_QUISA|nr:flocculation protein FLO11-like [Quillaja saponaria]
MSDPNQELVVTQNPEEEHQDPLEPTNLFAMLRLNSFNSPTINGCDHPNPSNHLPCTNCGYFRSNSLKRRSPSSFSLVQDPSITINATTTDTNPEPKAKKPFFEQGDLTLCGFSVISLPNGLAPSAATHTQKPQSCPVLRRCVSDPYNPPAANVVGFPMTQFQNSSSGLGSPENVKEGINPVTPPCVKGYASASSLPPLPPSLRRSVSDLTPSPAKSFSHSASSAEVGVDLAKEETSNSKRLRRMKESLREMRHWWDKAMREEIEGEAEEYKGTEFNDTVKKCDNVEERLEESVSIEKVGECLVINFKCPCYRGYQILLTGNNCYYKLI